MFAARRRKEACLTERRVVRPERESEVEASLTTAADRRRPIMGGSESMVPPERALPGREAKMRIEPKHYVLQTPMQAPWPPQL